MKKINDNVSKLTMSELTAIAKMFDDNDKKIIFNNENFRFKRPLNNCDMNFTVYDKNKGLTYLIDIDDMIDLDIDDIDENTIDELIVLAWKTKNGRID